MQGLFKTSGDSDGDVILFRFHNNFPACRERVKILAAFNPGMPVYGLFGGHEWQLDNAKEELGDLLVDIQPCPFDRPDNWKKRHSDLMIKHWYRTHGRELSFDHLYDYEWDMLFAAPLTDIYPDVGDEAVALCSVTDWSDQVETQWQWTRDPGYPIFKSYMNETFGLERLRFASHGPGPLLPRAFLERWITTEDIDLVLCEMSLPAYADALGFRVVGNNLRGSIFDREAALYFNCFAQDIPFDRIFGELSRPEGRRTFHPVKYLVTLRDVEVALDCGRPGNDGFARPSHPAGEHESADDRMAEDLG